MTKQKIKLEEIPVIDAIYNWGNFFEHEKGFQEYWNAVIHGYIINLDTLSSNHVMLFLKEMTEFFTGINPIVIKFQSAKGRLKKVREIAKKMHLKYKKLGKIGNTIHVGEISE